MRLDRKNPVRYTHIAGNLETANIQLSSHAGDPHALNSASGARSRTGAASPDPPLPFMRIRRSDIERAPQYALLNEKIAPYLRSENIDQLYVHVLERTESIAGRAATHDVMALLWASRDGLTQPELTELTGRREKTVARVVTAIASHLIWSGAIMTLSEWLRAPVESRYLPTSTRRHDVRMNIVEYFSRQPNTPRGIEEYPWQLHAAREWRLLIDVISRPAFALALIESSRDADLYCYWSAVGAHCDLVAEYEGRLDAYRGDERECLGAAAIYQLLGEFYRRQGDDDTGELLARRGNAIRYPILGKERPTGAEPLYNRTIAPENRFLSCR